MVGTAGSAGTKQGQGLFWVMAGCVRQVAVRPGVVGYCWKQGGWCTSASAAWSVRGQGQEGEARAASYQYHGKLGLFGEIFGWGVCCTLQNGQY